MEPNTCQAIGLLLPLLFLFPVLQWADPRWDRDGVIQHLLQVGGQEMLQLLQQQIFLKDWCEKWVPVGFPPILYFGGQKVIILADQV